MQKIDSSADKETNGEKILKQSWERVHQLSARAKLVCGIQCLPIVSFKTKIKIDLYPHNVCFNRLCNCVSSLCLGKLISPLFCWYKI